MTAGLMIVFAICIDALQFFVGLALTVVVGAGLAFSMMLGLLAYVVLWIWFKLSDNNTQNHFVLMRILVYYGTLVFEMIPGLDFFPGITFGVVSRILISWAGDAKANKIAEQEAEGKDLSAGKQRKLERRMQYKAAQEGVESVEQSRVALQQKTLRDAKPGKDQREVARRQEKTKAERKALDVALTVAAPEAKLATGVVESLAALRAHQNKKKGITGSPKAVNDNRPYASDRSEAA